MSKKSLIVFIQQQYIQTHFQIRNTNQEMAEADKNARVYLQRFEKFHSPLEDDLGVLIKKFADIGVKKFWFTGEGLPLFPNVSLQQLHEIFVKKLANIDQCPCLESEVKQGKLSQIYIPSHRVVIGR